MKPFRKKNLSSQQQAQYLESSAVRFLSYRPRFTSEVTNHLAQKAIEIGLSDPIFIIDQITKKLENSGFLNDADLLRSYMDSKLSKVRGPGWIRAKLRLIGLDRGQIESGIKKYLTKEKQLSILKEYLDKNSKLDLTDQKQKLRFIRRLLGRGFDYQIISQLFDQSIWLE